MKNSFPANIVGDVDSEVDGCNAFSMDKDGQEGGERRVDFGNDLSYIDIDNLNGSHLL